MSYRHYPYSCANVSRVVTYCDRLRISASNHESTTISMHPTVTHACWLVFMTSKCPNRVWNCVQWPCLLVGVSVKVASMQDSQEAPVRVFFCLPSSFWIQWHPYGTCTTPTTSHNVAITSQTCHLTQRLTAAHGLRSRDLAGATNFVTYSSQVYKAWQKFVLWIFVLDRIAFEKVLENGLWEMQYFVWARFGNTNQLRTVLLQ